MLEIKFPKKINLLFLHRAQYSHNLYAYKWHCRCI